MPFGHYYVSFILYEYVRRPMCTQDFRLNYCVVIDITKQNEYRYCNITLYVFTLNLFTKPFAKISILQQRYTVDKINGLHENTIRIQ